MRLLPYLLASATLLAADLNLGKPLAIKAPVPISTLLENPANYVGKPVQVKGKITEVCQMMGCWMQIASDDGKSIRIKVNDGDIEFPKDSAGKTAVAEGKFTKTVLTREQAVAQAKHEADEMGRKFDPATVKAPLTRYQIEGTGAVILSN